MEHGPHTLTNIHQHVHGPQLKPHTKGPIIGAVTRTENGQFEGWLLANNGHQYWPLPTHPEYPTASKAAHKVRRTVSDKAKQYLDLYENHGRWKNITRSLGHRMTWEHPTTEPINPDQWNGHCDDCGASIVVRAGGTTTQGHPDARTTECRPELREVYAIEARHRDEQITRWGADLARANAAQSN